MGGFNQLSPSELAMAQALGGQGNPAGPSKDEQRRVAALNFAIASRQGGTAYASGKELVLDAKEIATFIDRG